MPEGILGSNFTSDELLSLVPDWVVFLEVSLWSLPSYHSKCPTSLFQ